MVVYAERLAPPTSEIHDTLHRMIDMTCLEWGGPRGMAEHSRRFDVFMVASGPGVSGLCCVHMSFGDRGRQTTVLPFCVGASLVDFSAPIDIV